MFEWIFDNDILEWIYDVTLNGPSYLKGFLSSRMLFYFIIPLTLLFQYSPKINRTFDEAKHSTDFLNKFAFLLGKKQQGLSQKNRVPLHPAIISFAQALKIPWLLQSLDWFIQDILRKKLRLLPSPQTGQRINYLLQLFAIFVFRVVYNKMNDSSWDMSTANRQEAQDSTALFLNWAVFCTMLGFFTAILFLIRKNREFYLDILFMSGVSMMFVEKFFICWRVGCCFGVEWEYGVYNGKEYLLSHLGEGIYVFPTQLIEAAISFLGVILVITYMLFGKRYKPGQSITWLALCYTVPRFFWEYLRYRSPEYRWAENDVFIGLSMVQIFAVIVSVLAVLWLILLPFEKRLMDKFNDFIREKFRNFLGKFKYVQRWRAWMEHNVSVVD